MKTTYPTFRQALMIPLGWQPQYFDQDGQMLLNVEELTWVLRGDTLTGDPPYKYVCMNAMAENLPENHCSTPSFDSVDGGIPSYVTKYMDTFAKVWMAGAGWGRAKFPKPCPQIPL